MSDQKIAVGDKVRLAAQPPYLKTADPMPMLRPADLVAIAELGEVQERRPGNYCVVRFGRGAFLLDEQYLERVEA